MASSRCPIVNRTMGVLPQQGAASAPLARTRRNVGVIIPSAPHAECGSSTAPRMAFRMFQFRVIGFGRLHHLYDCTNKMVLSTIGRFRLCHSGLLGAPQIT